MKLNIKKIASAIFLFSNKEYMRKIKFYNEEYYHIYNRGVDKRKIFMDKNDYQRFLKNVEYFSKAKPPAGGLALELICYCLNPNHYHLLLKQKRDRGIENFMHKLGTGYTMYFNQKYNHSRALFQGPYQAAEVQDNPGLFWLSGYINGNSEIHNIALAKNYKWSSYPYYLNKRKEDICNKKDVLKQFKDINEYQDFIQIVIEEGKLNKVERKKYQSE